jgi:hypothetical protein
MRLSSIRKWKHASAYTDEINYLILLCQVRL